MKSNVNLGRILGVPVGLHWSWFLVFIFITWSLSLNYFAIMIPGVSPWMSWLIGLTTSLLFFTSVLAHELGHAIAAFHYHIPVRKITLFVFGGVADIEEEPHHANEEFWIALAGPITSLGLGILFAFLWFIVRNMRELSTPLGWLSMVNIAMAIFNMIPGFPLDGGRVLRALIWWKTRSYKRATRLASSSGQWVSYGFIGIGIVMLFTGSTMSGLWLAFVGWFLLNAAIQTYASQDQQPLLNVKVAQVMTRGLDRIPHNLTLHEVYENYYLTSGRDLFLVSRERDLCGMLSIDALFSVPRWEWYRVKVEQVMTPLNSLSQISADSALQLAIEAMERSRLAVLPVTQGQEITGYVSRDRVLDYLRKRNQIE